MRVATSSHLVCLLRNRLCHSAFVRVATFAPFGSLHRKALCHSAFVRVATVSPSPRHAVTRSLPQSIRAGCDAAVLVNVHACNDLCHSAFVRVATGRIRNVPTAGTLCHSAFVRVATLSIGVCAKPVPFATAHSCGLRLYFPNDSEGDPVFATAHSCGLRLHRRDNVRYTVSFATAHSCGLRLRKSNAAHCEFAARR